MNMFDPKLKATCIPYITQDGYDSGQAFVCQHHDVYVPIMEDDGEVQTYIVTLPQMEQLVADHRAGYL